MSVVIVSGASGLIGSEAALFYGQAGYEVVGIDNDMRKYFFGREASTRWNRERVHKVLGERYTHCDVDTLASRRFLLGGGCSSGPQHSGAQPHGFLSYLMKCAMTETPYTIIGYQGKQVRDIIHSNDVVSAFDAFFRSPRVGEVYNLGGGESNISVLEAITLAQEITGKEMLVNYDDRSRMGDHIWYVSDLTKFKTHYPTWYLSYGGVREIAEEIYEFNKTRWIPGGVTK